MNQSPAQDLRAYLLGLTPMMEESKLIPGLFVRTVSVDRMYTGIKAYKSHPNDTLAVSILTHACDAEGSFIYQEEDIEKVKALPLEVQKELIDMINLIDIDVGIPEFFAADSTTSADSPTS